MQLILIRWWLCLFCTTPTCWVGFVYVCILLAHWHSSSLLNTFRFGTALTTILPILFQYFYKYCYSDSRNLWAVMKAGRFGALKSESTHHFFRNSCTRSVSLRFSQSSGCWLILCVLWKIVRSSVILLLPLFT